MEKPHGPSLVRCRHAMANRFFSPNYSGISFILNVRFGSELPFAATLPNDRSADKAAIRCIAENQSWILKNTARQ